MLRILLRDAYSIEMALLGKTNSSLQILTQTMVMPLISGLMSGTSIIMTEMNAIYLMDVEGTNRSVVRHTAIQFDYLY